MLRLVLRLHLPHSGENALHEERMWIQGDQLRHRVTCILEDDNDSQERLRPYLPKSNVAWGCSSTLWKPSSHFLRVWLHRLGKNHRPLSKSQLQRFRENVARIMTQPEKSDLTYRIIRHHGYYGYDLYTLPDKLQCVLYRFSCAKLK